LAVVAGFIGGSGLLAVIAAHETAPHGLSVAAMPALRAVVLFAAVTAVTGVAPHTWEWAQFAAQWRSRAQPVLRAAAIASLTVFGGGALVVGGCLAVHNEGIAEVFDRTGGGNSGFLGLGLVSLIFLPNAACWAVGFASGPGVALASDAHLDFRGMDSGVLPGLPLTAGLPQPGALGWVALLPMLVPLAAGVATGWAVAPDIRRPVRGTLLPTAAAATLTGLLVGAVCWLSAGDGGGRLTQFGPSGWQVGGSIASELLVIGLPVAAIRLAVTRHRKPGAVPPARRSVENVPAALAPAPAAPTDDANRFPAPDLEDLEDTQEIPVIRLPLLGEPAGPPEVVEAELVDDGDDAPECDGIEDAVLVEDEAPAPLALTATVESVEAAPTHAAPISLEIFAEPDAPAPGAVVDLDAEDTQPIPVVPAD
jgi:hypothetical protein